MPTENRRVAAYLPQHIDQKLEAFKSDRGLKGDSQALVVILSEFFGVSQEVAYQGSSNVSQQIQVLEDKLAQIKNELLSEFRDELLKLEASTNERISILEAGLTSAQQVKVEVRDELLSELKSELSKDFRSTGKEAPGQLKLIPEKIQSNELPSESTSELLEFDTALESRKSSSTLEVDLEPLTGTALSKRFGFHDKTVNNNRNKWKTQPEIFFQWLKKHDPDGISWEYREDSKLYYPILESAISSNQVNPEAPEGSERSEEG